MRGRQEVGNPEGCAQPVPDGVLTRCTTTLELVQAFHRRLPRAQTCLR